MMEHLETLAEDPWKKGWLIKIKPTDASMDHLLDAEAYAHFAQRGIHAVHGTATLDARRRTRLRQRTAVHRAAGCCGPTGRRRRTRRSPPSPTTANRAVKYPFNPSGLKSALSMAADAC